MKGGSVQIANKKRNNAWDWSTVMTGDEIIANAIFTGLIAGECVDINLDTGDFRLGPRNSSGEIIDPVFRYDSNGLAIDYSGTSIEDEFIKINAGIDAKCETWLQSADPSTAWTSADLKTQHTGDLWYRTTDQTTWRWTGSTWTKQDAPSAVFDAIDGKSSIFVAQPTPPYEVGDLWAQGISGDLMHCITARTTGNYTSTDWTKASKYTDDSMISGFIDGDYADDLNEIRGQIDAKCETWYQSADPSTAWTSADLKTQHTGDLWYRTTDQSTWRWTGGTWIKQDAPSAVFDAIDGKSSIFVAQPTPPYEVGDLWILPSDTAVNGISYNKGTMLVSITARSSGEYVAADWTEKVDLSAWISNQINDRNGSIKTAKTVIDNNEITVSDGAITIKNKNGEAVTQADEDGNLEIKGTLSGAGGTFTVAVNITTADGSKVIVDGDGVSYDSRERPLTSNKPFHGRTWIGDSGVITELTEVFDGYESTFPPGRTLLNPNTGVFCENEYTRVNFGAPAANISNAFNWASFMSITEKETGKIYYPCITEDASLSRIGIELSQYGLPQYLKIKYLGIWYKIPVALQSI
ncbi:MAG: hypothetical protein ACRCSI_01055 [Eubacterium aggregans]